MKLLPTDWRPVQDGYEAGPADAPLSVVLIPGIRGDPREFIKLTPHIGGRIRILRTPEDMEPSLRSMADRILSGLPTRPFHLIGASCELTGQMSFKSLWAATLGEGTAWIVDASIALMCFSAAIIYAGILGDTSTQLLSLTGIAKGGIASVCH